jgi:hypothetical protein
MKTGLALLMILVSTVPSYAHSGVGPNGINATGLKLPNDTILTERALPLAKLKGRGQGSLS